MNETPEKVQRKWALIKIAKSDYLLPSNDKQTLWRITIYEDGPSHGLDPNDCPKDRLFWGAWKWTGREFPKDEFDLEDWDRWAQWVAHCGTRREAIGAVVGYEA